MRLIDADDTSKVFLKIMNLPEDYCGPSDIMISIDAVFSVLGQVPDADPVHVKHGHWEDIGYAVCCSTCGTEWTKSFDFYKMFKFCPFCGAKMDGDQIGTNS